MHIANNMCVSNGVSSYLIIGVTIKLRNELSLKWSKSSTVELSLKWSKTISHK
jgi:hypothetical protein